jgi:gamma-glutamyltranspeptidase/glutathione hydrolase
MIRNIALSLLLAAIFFSCINNEIIDKPALDEGRNIFSDSGMVVSAHSESSKIGVTILQKGGNAVDAAVATEFALAVCYPEAGNIGGGGFMLFRQADGRTDLIDYRERAPLKANRDMYLDQSGNIVKGLSTETHLASGVPGTVDGMINIHSKYGVLQFKDVIQPAINLAYNGFPVTKGQADDLNMNREKFLSRNVSIPAFVKNGIWEEGDTLRQPDLAHTLERIRDYGRDGFYSGTTAGLIIKEMQRGNGLISKLDLNSYSSVFRDPVKANYRNYQITTVAPPSGGGIILLQILGMLESYDLIELGYHSWKSVHLIAEAEKRAFADRAEYLGDPDFIDIPVNKLISSIYLKKRMESFRSDSASPPNLISAGLFVSDNESEETTHYSIVDSEGNAVAATTTLNNTFGNSIIVENAGFLLNNQMDDFSTKKGVPNIYGLTGSDANSVEPGKRMLSSMTPVIVEKEQKLFLVAGSPGGSTIPTSVMQVITNVIDYSMNIGQAVDAGRFHHQWLPDTIYFETNTIDTSTIMRLKAIGYRFKEKNSIGRVNAIMILPDGRKASGADKRGSNVAYGY